MTRIQPFRGWRYDLAAAGAVDLSELLTPPYDVISPAQQAAFYARHPHNVVRLDLPCDEPGDDDRANRYTRAAATLADWQARGVLRPESAPAIYLLQQRFALPDGRTATRRGLVFRLLATPWGEGVLPHERTFPTAKADRLALLIATGSQCSPIFLLYSDPAGEAQAPILAEAAERPPEAVYCDDEGVEHRLWAVTAPEAIAAAAATLASRTFYVADGHHRYETALNYRRWRRTGALPAMSAPPPLTAWEQLPGFDRGLQEPSPDPQPFDYAWVYAARLEDPGLIILPTHRCVHSVAGFDAHALLNGLRRYFTVSPAPDEAMLEAALAQAAPTVPRFGLALPGARYLLELQPSAEATALLHAAHHPTVAAVDVAVLQTLVLGPLLGIASDPAQMKEHVAFTPSAAEALKGLAAGRYQAVFLVNPTPLSQLQAVSEAGQVMPPKATYFYPKLPSGLVINVLDE